MFYSFTCPHIAKDEIEAKLRTAHQGITEQTGNTARYLSCTYRVLAGYMPSKVLGTYQLSNGTRFEYYQPLNGL